MVEKQKRSIVLKKTSSVNIFSNSFFVKETVLISGYFLIQFLANLTVGKRFSFFIFQIPIGSLLYVITFTWLDLINDYFGKKYAQILVLISIFFHMFAYFWFKLFLIIPDEHLPLGSFEQRAFKYVMGGYWRIFAASLISGFVSENIDIIIFNRIKYKTNYPRWSRSWISNIFSTMTDGTLFVVLAFVGTVPIQTLWTLAYSSSLYKLVIATISVPLIYMVKENKIERGMQNG
jgi:uncharacterized integral membrane protein (TIGR00697 family)